MSRRGRVRIGTSGWQYDSWRGPFYRSDGAKRDWLEEYQEHFDTVEVNNTFYSLPSVGTARDWHDRTTKDFRFAIKASRYLTHNKKLLDPDEPLERLFTSLEPLSDRLGPILFQLPPRWRANPERLDAFLSALPRGHRYAFEPRDPSWFAPAVYDALARHGAALCLYDLAGERSPVEVTSDFVYLRLHGPEQPYQGRYDGRTLFGWARRLQRWRRQGIDVYVFFNNDQKACAPADAHELARIFDRHRRRHGG